MWQREQPISSSQLPYCTIRGKQYGSELLMKQMTVSIGIHSHPHLYCGSCAHLRTVLDLLDSCLLHQTLFVVSPKLTVTTHSVTVTVSEQWAVANSELFSQQAVSQWAVGLASSGLASSEQVVSELDPYLLLLLMMSYVFWDRKLSLTFWRAASIKWASKLAQFLILYQSHSRLEASVWVHWVNSTH